MNPSGFYVDPESDVCAGHTYIMFILMCMYMNFHTSRMKFHIRNGGVFYLCRRIVSRHSVEVQILYGAFYEEKVLECSTLYQAGIVYKKENI